MPEFNEWFPASQYGTSALNVKSFGAIGDGTGRSLSGIYSTLAEAQEDFPSATDINDYVDWAAFTECFKQAFQHETSPGVWVPNAGEHARNRPVFIPPGRYVINKPLWWVDIAGAWIYGSSAMTNIHNEVGTPGQSSCVITNGFTYNRVENLNFGTVGGEASSKAFDLNGKADSLVSCNACIFINCGFQAPMGVAFSIADPASFPGSGNMGSETHFYHCNFSGSEVGCYIAQFNALNYSFVGCGGILNGTWLQVSAGGDVTVINASLSGNGLDINCSSDKCTVISTRTESNKFLSGGGITAISCTQTGEGRDVVFAEGGNIILQNCVSAAGGRVYGIGPISMSCCDFSGLSTFLITSITASPTSPLIRITHQAGSTGTAELWYDGDECLVELVTGSGAASINGTWIVTRINLTTIDLVGSVYGGTYSLTGHWTGAAARVKVGPRFHLRDISNPGAIYPSNAVLPSIGQHSPAISRTRDLDLLWADSGTVIDNYRATGPVIITLPSLNTTSKRGARYEFIVLAAQTLTVKVNPEVLPTYAIGSPRIVEATATTAEYTEISSNVIGSTIEIYLSDNDSGSAETFPETTLVGQRWVVINKTGTWTGAGTPVPD